MVFPEESGACGTLYRFSQFTVKKSVPLVVKSTMSRTVSHPRLPGETWASSGGQSLSQADAMTNDD